MVSLCVLSFSLTKKPLAFRQQQMTRLSLLHLTLLLSFNLVQAWITSVPHNNALKNHKFRRDHPLWQSAKAGDKSESQEDSAATTTSFNKRQVVVIGAGWGGLSAAHALSKDDTVEVTVIEASPRVGGLVRDGFTTISGQRPAEAGQHGFWNNYHNIFRLLRGKEIEDFDVSTALTDYAEQGQCTYHFL